ncbi:MAG: hypothetical protein ACPLRA_07260 [Candidatus Saccharicenans sp.]
MAGNKRFFLRAIFVPWKHFELYNDFRSNSVGLKSFLLLAAAALALSLTSLIQAACGNFPAVPVVLPIGLENYFFWQALLLIPWLVASWLLVSLVAGLFLKLSGAKSIKIRQLMVFMALSFSSFLFSLWIPHLLTAIFYLLGMSQKEWVDLLSEPGWFQTLYLAFIILAVLSGGLALNLSLLKGKLTKKWVSLIIASFSFLIWIILVFILLR